MARYTLKRCPETGRDLTGVDIAAHIETLWPRLDEKDPRFAEARKRRGELLDEHAARQTEDRART